MCSEHENTLTDSDYVGRIGDAPVLPSGAVVPISPAFSAGELVFLSGQLSVDAQGVLNTGSIEEQTALCLQNLDRVLGLAGLTLKHVVKVNIWLTEVADFAGFNSVYVDYFGDHRPARSTVRSDLMLPGARVEIEAVAKRSL